MRATLAISIIVSACASAGSPPLEHPGARTGVPTFDTRYVTPDVAEAGPFPNRLSAARLPTADAQHSQLRATGYAEVTTRLRLCVNARGETADVRIDENSGLAWFDEAVRTDVMNWRYEPFRAPATVRVCEPVTIRYLP